MQHAQLVTEEKLHLNSSLFAARGLIPELLFRLIYASIQNPTYLRVPVAGSVGQIGWDGVLISPIEFNPHIPEGKSFWEIGTGGDPQGKATDDFKKRTERTDPAERSISTFLFVTPLSAYRSWSEPDQEEWIRERRSNENWKDIRIIDGTKLVQWLYLFPGIDLWLAQRFGVMPTTGLTTAPLHWEELQVYGEPPPLKPDVFLKGRTEALEGVLKVFEGQTNELRLETKYPVEGIDFVSAALESLEPEKRLAYSGRCLIISDPETWRAMCWLQTPHVLVSAAPLDLERSHSSLRAQARARKHSTIFAASPSASLHGNTIRLSEQRPTDFEQALISCGYSHERARSVSFKSGGRVVILKRLLLDLSVSTDWATPTEAGDLRLAALIGSWDGSNEGDRDAIQDYLGKDYGEWIQIIRPKTLRQDPPLTQQNEQWRFVSRFEGWLGLGPFLSSDDLNQFRRMATRVLTEKDPKFDLPSEKRWRAVIHEKTRKYSDLLREGIAESIALLGTYPNAIPSCSNASVRNTAAATVHELLSGADWILWASLQDVLPLLAEGSPEEFLDAVEKDVAPLVELFQQEVPGPTGGTHMAGFLWALETLAWHPDYLTRVTLILGKLAQNDPGGRWNNRPSNSLTTIFLPWLPQTCASSEKRRGALELLLRDHPDVGWKLILELLPTGHQVSMGSRKPAWREWIPQDWQNGVTSVEYAWQVEQYARLLTDSASTTPHQLMQLIGRLDNLPRPALGKVLEHLSSEAVRSLPEQERLPVWEAIMSLVSKHRRFFDAEWAMPQDLVSQLAATGEAIAPASSELLYQRLFNEGDLELMDQPTEDYDSQRSALEARRRAAVSEIFETGGLEAVVRLAKIVRTPWRVGLSLGEFAPPEIDAGILPAYLGSDDKNLSQLVAGFVWARFKISGRLWATEVLGDAWELTQKVEFLIRLPFEKETWELAADRLGDEVSNYWAQASGNPYEVRPSDLPEATNQLLLSNRPDTALRCVDWAIRKKTLVEPQLATRTLKQLMEKQSDLTAVDFHQCMEIIAWLQKKLEPDSIDLQTIEWRYLALFDRQPGMTPRTLERRLATNPEFFAEVIRASFRPEHSESSSEPSEQELKIAANAHRLLRDWRTIPGGRDDGTINGTELDGWLSGAKEACKKSDHLNVALTIIGQVLSHAPADPDGTWIDRSVASVLDAPDGEKIREGFASGILNSRGARWGTKGENERKLSEAYKAKATTIDHLYPRLATTVRKIAQWYENLAEQEAAVQL